jgi:hypothetical protein
MEAVNTQASEIITKLSALFELNSFQFSFDCSMYLAGDQNKELRRQIIFQLTGEQRPLTRCGLFSTEDALKNSFQQYSLF